MSLLVDHSLGKTLDHPKQSRFRFSAGTGTCYLSGVKTNYEVVGVNAAVSSTDPNCKKVEANHVTSVMEMARRAGKAIGVVTTTRMYAFVFKSKCLLEKCLKPISHLATDRMRLRPHLMPTPVTGTTKAICRTK